MGPSFEPGPGLDYSARGALVLLCTMGRTSYCGRGNRYCVMVSEEVPPLLGLFENAAFFVTWVAILSLHCAGVAVIGAVDRTILLR